MWATSEPLRWIMARRRREPDTRPRHMRYETDQQRFLIVLGEAADRVTDDLDVRVLERATHVVLAETSYRIANELRRTDLVVHSYEREADARRVFGLFRS